MNVYSVTSLDNGQELAAAVPQRFESKNFLRVTDTFWFIADSQPLVEFSKKLGVKSKEEGDLAGIIILQVFVYWGHASVNIWQWLASKIEEKENG